MIARFHFLPRHTQAHRHPVSTPEVLVTQLQHTGIPQLEGLSIGFSTTLPRPGSEGEVLRAPITLRTPPALRWLSFRGISVYLEGLIARIDSPRPRLERFNITLFNQLNFTPPHLSHFTTVGPP